MSNQSINNELKQDNKPYAPDKESITKYIHLYLDRKLKPIPIHAFLEKPTKPIEDLELMNEKDILDLFDKQDYNVGILLKNGLNALYLTPEHYKTVIEKTKQTKAGIFLFEKLRRTWIVVSPSRYILLFFANEVPEAQGYSFGFLHDVAPMPPSRNFGYEYKFANNPANTTIVSLDSSEINLLLNIIKSTSILIPRDTFSKNFNDLIILLNNIYYSSIGNDIFEMLGFWLKHLKISFAIAEQSVDALLNDLIGTKKLFDNEVEPRKNAFMHGYNAKTIDELNTSFSGFYELIRSFFNQNEALEIVKKMQDLIGLSPFNDPAFCQIERNRFFVNDPIEKEISRYAIVFVKEKEILEKEKTIIRAAIKEIKIFRSPIGSNTKFEIVWITRAGRTFTSKGYLYDHLSKLKLEALVSNKYLSDDALASIIAYMEEKGKGVIIEDIVVEGFYIINNELVANPERLINYKDLDRFSEEKAKLTLALQTLNELIEKWYDSNKEKAITILKWVMLAPFNFAKKQLGLRPMPYLMLIGPGGTGKSTLANLGKYIWDLPTFDYENTGQGVSTPYRLGNRLERWTYPIAINEPAELFDNQTIREMIKNAWDSMVARAKGHYGFYTYIPSFANLIFVTNEPIDRLLSEAERRRLIILRFTWNDKIPEKRQVEFEDFIPKLKFLSALGDWIYTLVKGKDLELLKKDWETAAEKILEEIYTYSDLPVPDWIMLRAEKEKVDPTEEWKQDIILALKNYVADVLVKYKRIYDATSSDFGARLSAIKDNELPSYVYLIDEKEVIILRGFIDYLREKGVKISHLRDLAELMGWKYARRQIRKLGINKWVVSVPLNKLFPKDLNDFS